MAPNPNRKARPTAQPRSNELNTARAVLAPERNAVTAVDPITTNARGAIHLRPMMSATVSSATIETMTASSGSVRPSPSGRVRAKTTSPRRPSRMSELSPSTTRAAAPAAASAWTSCIGRPRTKRSVPTASGRTTTPMPESQLMSWRRMRGSPLVARARSCSRAPVVPTATSARRSEATRTRRTTPSFSASAGRRTRSRIGGSRTSTGLCALDISTILPQSPLPALPFTRVSLPRWGLVAGAALGWGAFG